MSLISIVIVLIIVGFLLWLINNYIPMGQFYQDYLKCRGHYCCYFVGFISVRHYSWYRSFQAEINFSKMPEKISIHCFISGRVQGVWFRASAKEQADRHGITGFACNLPDGRVEVVASGEKEKVMQFHAWLKRGPALAE